MTIDLTLMPKYWMSIVKIIGQHKSNLFKTKSFHFHDVCTINKFGRKKSGKKRKNFKILKVSGNYPNI